MKQLFFFLAMICVAASCGSDVDCDANSFVNEINAEVTKVNTASANFSNDPTEDNCKAFKDAADEYLDAVEQYDSCDEIDQVQFSDQLTQARQLVAQIDCG